MLHEHIVVYRLDGALFFGAAQRFLTDLTAVTDVRVVVLRLGQVQVLDATGAHALGEIVRELEDRHITVLFASVPPRHLGCSRRSAPSIASLTSATSSIISTTRSPTPVATPPDAHTTRPTIHPTRTVTTWP